MILLTIVIAFVCGTVSGIFLGYDMADVVNTEKRICDMCDSKIADKETMFCGDCFEEESEDALETALKQREGNIRYKNASLRQRTVIDKPLNEELEVLGRETKEIDELCDGVERVTNVLKMEVDVQPLRDVNKILKDTMQKWQTINHREDAVSRFIQEDF